MAYLEILIDGLRLAGDMAWLTWWALVLGFTIAGAVEAFVSEELYVSNRSTPSTPSGRTADAVC